MRRILVGLVFLSALCASVHAAMGAEPDEEARVSRFYEAWGLDPRNPQSLTDFGTVMANSGQIEEGRLYYEKALAQDPGFREAAYGVAILDLDSGKVIEAVVALNRLSRGQDEFAARAHHRLARQSAMEGFPDEAFGHFVRANEILPENLELGLDLGTALIRRERYAEALSLADQLLQAHPESPMSFFLRGQALLGQGDTMTARQAFQEAVRLDERQPWALFELGGLAQEAGDLELARTLYREALSAASARGEAALARRARRAVSKLPARE